MPGEDPGHGDARHGERAADTELTAEHDSHLADFAAAKRAHRASQVARAARYASRIAAPEPAGEPATPSTAHPVTQLAAAARYADWIVPGPRGSQGAVAEAMAVDAYYAGEELLEPPERAPERTNEGSDGPPARETFNGAPAARPANGKRPEPAQHAQSEPAERPPLEPAERPRPEPAELPPPETAQRAQSEPEPARSESAVTAAIARNKRLVLACAVGLALLGLVIGSARKGTYTAAATLQVGKVNPNSPGFYGFVQSAGDLATVFSRAISASPVLAAVHDRLHLSRSEITARLSAAPIPTSPAFRVIATGPTASAAIGLANTTSKALIAYEARANSYGSETTRLLGEYHAAALSLASATAATQKAAHEYSLYPFAAQRAVLQRDEAARSAAALRAQGLSSSYQLSAQSTTAGLVTLVAGAATASSDRAAQTEFLGFIGLLGGLVIGCSLAVVRERRRAPLGTPPVARGDG